MSNYDDDAGGTVIYYVFLFCVCTETDIVFEFEWLMCLAYVFNDSVISDYSNQKLLKWLQHIIIVIIQNIL